MYRMRRRKMRSLLEPDPLSRHNNRRLFVLLLAVLCAAAAAAIFTVRMRPVITQVAASEAADVVTGILNDAVTQMIEAGQMEYSDLVHLEKDQEGRITALVTNMAKVNLLQSEVSSRVLELLYERSENIVEIPLGSLLGSTLLAGRGPDIPIKVISVTSVFTNFSNEFATAGINQTRHLILLDVQVELEILLPGYTDVMVVDTEVNVAETVIVGDVPDTYAEFGQAG